MDCKLLEKVAASGDQAATQAHSHGLPQQLIAARSAMRQRPLLNRSNHGIFRGRARGSYLGFTKTVARMIDTVVKPRTKAKPKTERPKLHKVILVNDDYTPREFVVTVAQGRVSHDRGPGP